MVPSFLMRKRRTPAMDLAIRPSMSSTDSAARTSSTRGRVFKVETTSRLEVGDRIGLDFGPEDIHVMHKEVAVV